MTSTSEHSVIPFEASAANHTDRSEVHRQWAMDHCDDAADLAEAALAATFNGEEFRRINQQLSVALKLAGVHAELALASATIQAAQ